MTHPTKQECPMKGRHMSAMHRDACPVCNPNKTVPELNAAAGDHLTSNERLHNEVLQQWIGNFDAQRDHPVRRLLLELRERRSADETSPNPFRRRLAMLETTGPTNLPRLEISFQTVSDMQAASDWLRALGRESPRTLEELTQETSACDCPEVCKVCGGRAKACALLGHRPEGERYVKWHKCAPKASDSDSSGWGNSVNCTKPTPKESIPRNLADFPGGPLEYPEDFDPQ